MPNAAITTLDPPFLAPLEAVIDLPFPPSTNRIWAHATRKVHLSPVYRAWKQQADLCAIADRNWRSKPRMPAEFQATILLDRAQRMGDVDNRIKAVLDWAQRVELIKNDKLCAEVTARWVPTTEAPSGCRLILRSGMTFLMPWATDRVDALRQFWADGLSATQIAVELGGCTRNAVIGKLHRLGLRRNDAQPKGPPKPKAPPSARRLQARLERDPGPAAPPRSIPAAPNSLPVDIMGLNNETCRWPLWETDSEPRMYCGALEADLSAGCPYCDFHRRGGT